MPQKRSFDLVVACTLNGRGIGRDGQIPWKLKKDLAFFKQITQLGKHKNACIMGRATYESIGKPLPGRHNIVLSKANRSSKEGVHYASTLKEGLQIAEQLTPEGRTFVIGGQKIFEEAIPDCRYIFETRINKDIQCDRFMPEHRFPAGFISKTLREGDVNFDICQYHNPSSKETFKQEVTYPQHEQYQYIECLKKILQKGHDKQDRTQTGTRSLFGDMMRFDLSESFPLLTTKKVFWRGVVEQLLWFIRGSTNGNQLKQKKVLIWDGNSSRQYLDSIGLTHREEGDLGPIYGFQWRHWNAPYKDMHTDYTNQGIDQLSWLIDEIRRNPSSRRLILSAWNPGQLKQMALPPCHVLSHFDVSPDGRLNCLMYQRSCDMGLGVPFNIASYALLTCIIAQITGLKRGQFIHVMGDTHIYQDHIEKLKPQLLQEPFPFPYLKIDPSVTSIDRLSGSQLVLEDYSSHAAIKMKMAV